MCTAENGCITDIHKNNTYKSLNGLIQCPQIKEDKHRRCIDQAKQPLCSSL